MNKNKRKGDNMKKTLLILFIMIALMQFVDFQLTCASAKLNTYVNKSEVPSVDPVGISSGAFMNRTLTIAEKTEQLTMTVFTNTEPHEPITIPFSVNGTARFASGDHDLQDGSIIIPSGQLSGTMNFQIFDDYFCEFDEQIFLTFNNIPGVSTGAQSYSLVIQDNDCFYNDIQGTTVFS